MPADDAVSALGIVRSGGRARGRVGGIGAGRRVLGRGFTLLETALATVVLGVGVLALIEAHGAFTRHNRFSSSSTTGVYLANEIRERMRGLPRHDPVNGLRVDTGGGQAVVRGWGRETGETSVHQFNDVDDFDGVTFGTGGNFVGPIDCVGQTIVELGINGEPIEGEEGGTVSMRGWSQAVRVEKVDPFNAAQVRAAGFSHAPDPPSFPGVAVDRFPLRVTVTVRYQDPGTLEVQEMARVSWIVP
jgi:type II secretory pathway pseudopilin PulG